MSNYFDYFATASNTTKFRSEDGLTLGQRTRHPSSVHRRR